MPQTITVRVLLSCFVCAVASCSRGPTVQTTRITGAELSTVQAEESAAAVRNGAFRDALAHGDQAVALAPDNPWAHYDRAVALHHLGQTDAAVQAYRDAEARFPEAERWGKSLAVYGRARSLDDAGRCGEARATYADFASMMRSSDPRAAEMALRYGRQCEPKTTIGARESDVATAVVARDYRRALELADGGRPPAEEEADPWLDYNRAVALVEIGRVDEAVDAFKRAENGFGPSDQARPGRAVAVYGRARALDQAGRCAEAKKAYDEYASIVRQDDPSSASLAGRVARQCKEP